MKYLACLIVFITSQTLFASECKLIGAYEELGWKVHSPHDFNYYLKKVKQNVKSGLEQGELVLDLEGTLSSTRTVDHRRIYMGILSWDSLLTRNEVMYGDFAIFQNKFEPYEYLEVRWFESGKKHVVYNDKSLNCISIIPPFSDNSIL